MSKINIYKRQVRIGKLDWDIDILPEDKCDELDGRCSTPMNARIQINPELEDFNELDTVYHEIFHAIDAMRHINLTEEQVTMLGNSMASLFLDNPWLITYTNQKVRKILFDC